MSVIRFPRRHRLATAIVFIVLCIFCSAAVAEEAADSGAKKSYKPPAASKSDDQSSGGSAPAPAPPKAEPPAPPPPPAPKPEPAPTPPPPPPPAPEPPKAEPPPAPKPEPPPAPTPPPSSSGSSEDRSGRSYRPVPAPDNNSPSVTAKPQESSKSDEQHTVTTGQPTNPPPAQPKKSDNAGSSKQSPPPSYRPPAANGGSSVVITGDKKTEDDRKTYRPEPETKSPTRVTAEPGSSRQPSGVSTTPTQPSNPTSRDERSYKPGKVTHYLHYVPPSRARDGRRSCYYHYDHTQYVEVARVVVETYPEVIYVDRPVYETVDYYPENAPLNPLNEAFADIRAAFLAGRFDLIQAHVAPKENVAVFLDGKYDYSISGDDYLQITHDALESLQTVGFVWDRARPRSDGSVTGFAQHTFYQPPASGLPDGDQDLADPMKTVYVTFTLRKQSGVYYITEVGSSEAPML